MEFQDNKHLLKHNEMDEIHKEFIQIYNGADYNSIGSIINKTKELFEHTKRHFSYEESQMDQFNYPTSREHKEEHQKVLHEMQFFLEKSNTSIGKQLLKAYYKQKLPDWFDLHLISMDSDLAGFLKQFKKG
ncbi:bacteriohemerythrin [Arcobacter arenosus]|uniref:bacteriohemerythrin n=1 Tax=Arcobacter arenosus TaxID=2576037 RepID=UPI003BA9ED40